VESESPKADLDDVDVGIEHLLDHFSAAADGAEWDCWQQLSVLLNFVIDESTRDPALRERFLQHIAWGDALEVA
jgi:hypothetical protein